MKKKIILSIILCIIIASFCLAIVSCSNPTIYEVTFDFNISTRNSKESFPNNSKPDNFKIKYEEDSYIEEPDLSKYLKKWNQYYRYWYKFYDHRDSNGKLVYKYTNYNFTGWYQDSGLSVPWKFASDTIKTNMTLYAKWETTTSYGY